MNKTPDNMHPAIKYTYWAKLSRRTAKLAYMDIIRRCVKLYPNSKIAKIWGSEL